MKRLPILIVFLARGFAAEIPATPPAPAERVMRMFALKYADAEQLRKLFSGYSYPMIANRDFNVLTVTASPGFLAQVEAAVKEFDVAPSPPKNIELTVYFLAGADAPGIVPKELAQIEKQLTAGGAYKGFRLADTQVIRTRPGQPGESGGIRLRAAWINSSGTSRVISFDGLKVNGKATSIGVDIDLPEGQAVVLGKSSLEGPDKPSVLVAAAKVTE